MRQIIRARWAVAAIFCTNGAAIGIWAANIPGVRERLALDPQVLSFGFLAMAVGALIGMPLGGWLIAHMGSARVTLLSGIAMLTLLPVPVLAPHFGMLVLGLWLFGLANGTMDVAMNAHGVLVEHKIDRPVMSSFHAMWSIGGLAGSALGGWALMQFAPTLTIAAAALLGLAAFGLAVPSLLNTNLDKQAGESHFALPKRVSLALGLLAFLAMMSEGAILDWSGVYLRDLRATPALAAAGFAGFSATMAFGRFFGDALRHKFGAGFLVRLSGMISAAGLALALIAPTPLLAVFGFAAMGIGIANIAPVIYGAAGRLKGVASGVSIASVITLGYAGFTAGPPVIGFVAEQVSLRGGLALIGLACLAIAALSSAAET